MPREGRRRREKKSDSISEQGADDAASSKTGADDPAETEVAAGRSQGGGKQTYIRKHKSSIACKYKRTTLVTYTYTHAHARMHSHTRPVQSNELSN